MQRPEELLVNKLVRLYGIAWKSRTTVPFTARSTECPARGAGTLTGCRGPQPAEFQHACEDPIMLILVMRCW